MPNWPESDGPTGGRKRRKPGSITWRNCAWRPGKFYMNIQPDFRELLLLLKQHGVDYMVDGTQSPFMGILG